MQNIEVKTEDKGEVKTENTELKNTVIPRTTIPVTITPSEIIENLQLYAMEINPARVGIVYLHPDHVMNYATAARRLGVTYQIGDPENDGRIEFRVTAD